MSQSKSFYITTTIPYVNADPHIGFALELVQADAAARYQRHFKKREVFFSTGTDEYGQKIWEAAQKEGKDAQEYVDHYAEKFLSLCRSLNISNDNFIRTTSPENIAAAQKFWRLCKEKGDIYEKEYKGLYCVGCERFLKDKDLVDGKCPFHPTLTPEMVEEKNYFFKLTRYKKELLEYLADEKTIIPEWRRKEALDFVENGMEDFSVSRSKERFSWGIPIPGDDTQVMYVWFGAFVNYLSTLGWPKEKEKFEKFWVDGEKVQNAGKDMVKFQSVMWQGMLLSAGLPNTDKVMYHGFITGEGGARMSKSQQGNVSPQEIIDEYGADALRYFLLREVSTFEDSPFTVERFKETYNANLANGLGNLASRILTLSEKYLDKCPEIPDGLTHREFHEHMTAFDTKVAADHVWNQISELDKYIQQTEPYKLIKSDEKKGKEIITELVLRLYAIARMLYAHLPETNEKLKKLIEENKKPEAPLFPRKD